jgi:hypothetical protein
MVDNVTPVMEVVSSSKPTVAGQYVVYSVITLVYTVVAVGMVSTIVVSKPCTLVIPFITIVDVVGKITVFSVKRVVVKATVLIVLSVMVILLKSDALDVTLFEIEPLVPSVSGLYVVVSVMTSV